MRIIRWTTSSIALAATVLLAGCGTMDPGGVYRGDRGPSSRDPYYDRVGSDVQGTVVRVNTRDRLIFLDRRDGGRYDLRNDDDRSRTGGAEIAVYYDDRTTVEYQGRTYRPEDLEAGDRIQAIVARNDQGLFAQSVQVLYDASTGADRSSGTYDQSATSLRGTVRTVDTRNQTVEIQSSSSSRYDSSDPYGRSGVVLVQYDSATTVEFQGRRYDPTNLERGDVVEISLRRDRDRGSRLTADQITVVGDAQGGRR